MDEAHPAHLRPHTESILRLIERQAPLATPVTTIAEFVSIVREVSDNWQKEDWVEWEKNEEIVLNNARLVGQVWFRGHGNCDLTLRPGLYRTNTRQCLGKQPGSPVPQFDPDDSLFSELFALEHDQRVDFTSYGHLLNEGNQAKNAIDWYFLMQHHGIPTRLLDWSTNALAALFFALDSYRQRIEDTRRLCPDCATASSVGAPVGIWMIDAYWLAKHLSDVWNTPLLPWSEDAERYVPPLEKLIDKMRDSVALLPDHPMPIEPPAMHPRVAAQEGRFIIFGRKQDLVEERIRLDRNDDGTVEEFRVRQIQFQVGDVDSALRDLAMLGVSRRTLFPDLAGLADFVRWKHFHKVSGYRLEP